MKRRRIKQVIAIEAKSASEFQDKYNEATRSHDHFDDEQVGFINGVYSALLFYTIVEEEAETVRDEFHLKGIHYKCKHCPYMDDPQDGRVKHCDCRYAEYGTTHKYDEACEVFYKDLKLGKIKPLEDYERR